MYPVFFWGDDISWNKGEEISILGGVISMEFRRGGCYEAGRDKDG